MTLKIKGVTVIRQETPRNCEQCGNIAELRPYGKNGAFICFDCGMKDETETQSQFAKRHC